MKATHVGESFSSSTSRVSSRAGSLTKLGPDLELAPVSPALSSAPVGISTNFKLEPDSELELAPSSSIALVIELGPAPVPILASVPELESIPELF